MAQQYASRAALRSPPHITLHMPFHFAVKNLGALERLLQDFSETRNPLNIRLQGFGAFPPKVIYLNVIQTEELSVLQSDLIQTLKPLQIFNANYRDKPFHPHVTVAFRDLRKSNFHSAWAQMMEMKFEEDLVIEGLTLLIHRQKQWVPACTYKFNAKST